MSGIILLFFVSASLFFLCGYSLIDWPKYAGQEAYKRHYQQWNAENGEPNPASPEAIARYKYSDEKQHRIHEKIFWVSSIMFGVPTVIFAGAAAIAGYFSYTTALLALKSEDRPYVSVADEDDIFNGARINPQTGFFNFYGTWSNNGNSATKIEIATYAGEKPEFKPIYFAYDWIIGPKSKFRVVIANQTPEQIRTFSGDKKFHIYTRMRYYDAAFGVYHLLGTCIQVESPNIGNGIVYGIAVPCPDPATNCSDSGCDAALFAETFKAADEKKKRDQ